MPIGKIDFRPYINNPDLCISRRLLASLKKELRMYRRIVKTRPEYQKYIPEIEREIEDVKMKLKKKGANK